MAKNLDLQLNLKTQKHNIEEVKLALADLSSSFGDKFSAEISASFDDLNKQSINLLGNIEKFKGVDIDPSTVRMFSVEAEKLARASEELAKSTETDLGFRRETEEIKKMQAEIEKTIKLLDKANSDREKFSHASSNKAKDAELKNRVTKEFVAADYIKPGENLGKASDYLRQNLVNVAPVLKNINSALEQTYQKRKALLDLEKKTPKQEKELKEVEKDIAKLTNMRGIINSNQRDLDTETGYFNYAMQRADEYKIKLEELNKEMSRLKMAQGSPPEVEGLKQVASGVVTSEKDSRMDLKVREKIATASQNEEFDPAGGMSKKDSDAVNALIAKYFSLQAVLKMTERAISHTLKVIGELDQAFIGIAVVTQYTTKEVWGMHGAFQSIAKEAGFTTAEIAKVAGEYFRQGESYSNVLLLTEAAAKAAKVAGIDAAESVRYLTSAVRGYNLAAKDAMDVSDKFAALSAASATSYEGLATAMSKVSAQAYASGVEMDNLMGLLATSMEVTQEAPENIGTAFKTIFARMAEIKDYGKVLEDGVDANRIEKALKTVNVQLFDQNRNMRALDDVLLEVGSRWHTLNQSQKAYIATSLAGTRQQTRLLAVFENYDRTLENIETSRNSAGATEAQQIKNMQSIEHSLNKVSLAIDNIITSISNNEFIVIGIEALAAALEGVAGFLGTFPGKIVAIGTAALVVQKVFKQIKTMALTDEASQIAQLFTTIGAGKEKVLGAIFNFKKMQGEVAATGAAAATASGGIKLADMSIKQLAASITLLGKVLLIGGSAFFIIKAALQFFDKQAEKTTNTLKELRAELYEINQKQTSLDKLIDEYNQLNNKILKTSEDLERQKEILQLIKDMDMEGKYTIEIGGKMSEAGVNKMKEDLEAERRKVVEENFQIGLKNERKLEKHKSKGNDEIVSAIIETQAIMEAVGGNLDAWGELNSDVQNLAKQMIESGKDLPETIMRTMDGKEFTGDYSSIFNSRTGQMQHMAFGADGEVINLERDDTKMVESIEKYLDLLNNAEESTISVAAYYAQLKTETGEYFEAIPDPFKDTLENFKEFSNITVTQLRQAETAFEQISKNGIELTEGMKKNMIEGLNNLGSEGFMHGMSESLQAAGASMGQVVDLSRQMVDVFDELTQDQLLDALHSFDSMEKKIYDINQGLDNFNTESLRGLLELAEQYPSVADDMIDSIIATGEISEAVQAKMMSAEKQRMMAAIEGEIDQNEVRIQMAEQELKLLDAALGTEAQMRDLAARQDLDLTENSVRTLYSALAEKGKGYEDFFNKIINMAAQAGIEISENLEGAQIQGSLSYSARESGFSTKEIDERMERIKSLRDAQKESLTNEITSLRHTNEILKLSLGKMENKTWNKGAKVGQANKKDAKAAKEAAEKVEEYSGELHKLYVAKKRLELAKWGNDLLKSKQAYKEVADEVRGLAGAFDRLSKETTPQMIEDEYAALGLKKEQLEHIIKVSEEYQRHLESKLNPALKGTYTVINGQIIPVSAKYKNLTLSQMKELDQFAKKFNELGKEVDGYKTELLSAEQAQNEIIKGMYETIVEYQETLIDAIKNQEKKQMKSFKKIIDANKAYLEERKKLYEQSFEDQDKDEEAESLQEQRQKLIEKLANLEAAHDITSIKRREDYRKELQDLNDQYNRIQLERNREAMLESISNQIQFQDDIYQKEEEAYQARISSGEWLEERLKQIQDEARIQAMLDQELHQLSVQKLLEYGYITQEQITEAGITNTNIKVGDLSREQLQIFQTYWTKNRDVIDHMWNGVGSRTGAVELSERAMDNILNYLIAHSTQMEGKTSTMQKAVVNQWKAMMQKVNEYTKSFNAITLKAPNYSNVSKGMNDLLKQVTNATNGIVYQYSRIEKSAKDAANAQNSVKDNRGNKPAPKPKATTYSGVVTSSSSRHAYATVTDSNGKQWKVENSTRGVFLDGKKTTSAELNKKFKGIKWSGGSKAFATGGTTERTGLHWLDGKPGSPERVLSPGANAKFESLLADLSRESRTRTEGGQGYDPEVVSTLLSVVDAIYESSAENANVVADAIASIPKGKGVLDIASKHGINYNRRGDK